VYAYDRLYREAVSYVHPTAGPCTMYEGVRRAYEVGSSYTLPSLWPLSTPHIAGLHGFGGEASAGGGMCGVVAVS
jgi:hypothetical protein